MTGGSWQMDGDPRYERTREGLTGFNRVWQNFRLIVAAKPFAMLAYLGSRDTKLVPAARYVLADISSEPLHKSPSSSQPSNRTSCGRWVLQPVCSTVVNEESHFRPYQSTINLRKACRPEFVRSCAGNVGVDCTTLIVHVRD
jgi:hypothetical protein